MSSRRKTGRRPPAASVVRPGYGSAVSGDPFAGVERVFIDGSNLLYALARGSGGGRAGGDAGGGGGPEAAPPAPAGAMIGRIRAAFPPEVIVDLVFDGPPVGGIKGRLATGLRVSYSGRLTADRIIDEGVGAQLAADGPAATWGILVVTDDRGLRDAVTAKGARAAGTAWLGGRMGRLSAEPPAPRRTAGGGAGTTDRESRARGRGGPVAPLPRAGTTIGHRRAPRPPRTDPRDDD